MSVLLGLLLLGFIFVGCYIFTYLATYLWFLPKDHTLVRDMPDDFARFLAAALLILWSCVLFALGLKIVPLVIFVPVAFAIWVQYDIYKIHKGKGPYLLDNQFNLYGSVITYKGYTRNSGLVHYVNTYNEPEYMPAQEFVLISKSVKTSKKNVQTT